MDRQTGGISTEQAARWRTVELGVWWFDAASFASVAAWALLLGLTGHGAGWMASMVVVWAVILLVHGVKVFVLTDRLGPTWEVRKARELLERVRIA